MLSAGSLVLLAVLLPVAVAALYDPYPPYGGGNFGGLGGVLLFSWLGTGLWLFGWVRLGRAVRALAMNGPGPRASRIAWVYVASIAAIPVGIVAAISVSPLATAFALVVGPMYAPLVYGPVVAAHGVLFLLVSRLLPTKRASRTLAGGGLILLALAVSAIAIAVAAPASIESFLPIFLLGIALSGATVVGYALSAIAFRAADRTRLATRA